jgi:hypothetical protein
LKVAFALLVCTWLKTEFDSCACFHVSVSEDDFPVVSDINVCIVVVEVPQLMGVEVLTKFIQAEGSFY